MLTKVVAVQAKMGSRLNLAQRIHLFKQRADFICLPEYFLLDDGVTDFHRAALLRNDHLEYYERLSDELSTCLISGTVVEAEEDKLYNTCYVFNRGEELGSYRKRFPVPGELERGISPGTGQLVIEVEGVRIGIIVCGDVFYEQVYQELAERGVDLVFAPTTSPYRPADSISRKEYRDQIYFHAGATRCGAFVVKVCGTGRLFGKPLQGRTLITGPWGMVKQVDFSEEQSERVLSETLSISELREFRQMMNRRNSVSRTRRFESV